MSHRPDCGSHGGITVGQDVLDVLVFLFQCHVADVMLKVTVSTDVAGLATSVAGLCERFECPSVVNVHRDARG
jgi:hypothetical protein